MRFVYSEFFYHIEQVSFFMCFGIWNNTFGRMLRESTCMEAPWCTTKYITQENLRNWRRCLISRADCWCIQKFFTYFVRNYKTCHNVFRIKECSLLNGTQFNVIMKCLAFFYRTLKFQLNSTTFLFHYIVTRDRWDWYYVHSTWEGMWEFVKQWPFVSCVEKTWHFEVQSCL